MIYFTSDLHLGHRNIANFGTRPISGPIDNEYWICEHWQNTVSNKKAIDKQDVVYILGDAAFDEDSLRTIQSLNGLKVLIGGNHDVVSPLAYDTYKAIHGLHKRYGFWLSHAPIHESELRGKPNLHGHTHDVTIADPRYFNCCVDNLYTLFGKPMISLDELRHWSDQTYSPLHA